MSVLCELPNVAKAFEKLKIILDLRNNADAGTSLGLSITYAIDSKGYTTDEIISFVKSQALDNPELMGEIIGIDLVSKILSL